MDNEVVSKPATAFSKTLAVIANMRFSLTILFIWILSSGHSQTIDLIGIYQADWGGPSFRYVQFDCDSTYHFITHWDFGGKKDVEPSMIDKKKWRVQNETEVILETPTYGIKSFTIQQNGGLSSKVKRQTNIWTKIVTYDKLCSIKTYLEIGSSTNYTLTSFLPGLIILFTEDYENGKLRKRVTYYNLTDKEIEDFVLKKGFTNKTQYDPIMFLKLKISEYDLFWPTEKIEKWDNETVTTTFFDKEGKPLNK